MAKNTSNMPKAPTFKDVADLKAQLTAQFSASGGALLNICHYAVIGIKAFPETFKDAKQTEQWVFAARDDRTAPPSKQSAYKIRQFIEMAFRWDREGVRVVSDAIAMSAGQTDRYNRILNTLADIKANKFETAPSGSVIEKSLEAFTSSKDDNGDKTKRNPKDPKAVFVQAFGMLRDWHGEHCIAKGKGKDAKPTSLHPDLTAALAVVATYANQFAAEIKARKDLKRANKQKDNKAAKDRAAKLAKQNESAALLSSLAQAPAAGRA
jgi:hypothetical protein